MKVITSNVIEDVYCVLGKRPVKAVDDDCLLMIGVEYSIADELSKKHIHYMLEKYPNIAIYKRDKTQCISVFPKKLNLLYTNI